MLKAKTVLVLGAGASMDYGYPSGATLLEQIRTEAARVSSGDASRIGNGPVDRKKFRTLVELIDTVNFESIDAVLESHTDLIEIGKLLIARCLIPCENAERPFYRQNRSDNWLHYLFKAMAGPKLTDFMKSELSVVTFNYDRLFEYFVRRQLKDWYQETDANVNEAMERIPVIHLHGVLSSITGVEYGRVEAPFVGDVARRASLTIEIIHEAHPDSKAFARAHEVLRAAIKVGFFGFGFHPTNLARLELQSTIKSKRIYGTALGLKPPELTDFRSRLNHPDSAQMVDGNCLKCLRETDFLF